MKRETFLLKTAVIFIGIPVLALCIFLVPEIAEYMTKLCPEIVYINYLVYIGLYLPTIPFYIALYQAFRLLCYIDGNKAFSDLSVKALTNIKYCAGIICIIFTADMPLFYLFGDRDDAPGVILIGMVIICASFVIAVFAAVLRKLLKHAIDIKSENDLTV
jgi:nitric oxide reductase large subunit